MANIQDLTGKDLSGFKIMEMTQIFRVNEDGQKTVTLGVFKDPIIAKAFAEAQKDASWHRIEKVMVLTDGNTGYVIGQQESIKLFNDETEAVALKEKAIAKLSESDRLLLGLKQTKGFTKHTPSSSRKMGCNLLCVTVLLIKKTAIKAVFQ